jgi:hypothetical protein
MLALSVPEMYLGIALQLFLELGVFSDVIFRADFGGRGVRGRSRLHLEETVDILSGPAPDPSFETLEPDIALPGQFEDMWSRSRRTAPEPRLALAVLQLAVVDYCKFRSARLENERRLYRKAYAWITSQDRGWPYSFQNLCEVIAVSPDTLRTTLLGASAEARARTVVSVGKLLDTGST